MRKLWWILIIVGIILIGIGIYSYITFQQVKKIQKGLGPEKQQELKTDMQLLAEGDCTKLKKVKTEINEMQTNIKNACKNPFLRIYIEKEGEKNTCKDLEQSNNKLNKVILMMENHCKNN